MEDINFAERRTFLGPEDFKERQVPLGRVNLDHPLQLDVKSIAERSFPLGRYIKMQGGSYELILDEQNNTILQFVREGGAAGFTSINSPLTRDELTVKILSLPKGQQDLLREVLHLPKPSRDEVKAFQEKQAQRVKEQAILEDVLSLPSLFSPESVNKDKIKMVDQSLTRGVIQTEYAITNATSDKPIIGTGGLGPCISLVIYDAHTNTAAVGHISPTTDVDSLDLIFFEFTEDLGKIGQHLEIGLIGGDSTSRNLAIRILKYLKERNVRVSYADILNKYHPLSFVIDSRTGEKIPNVVPRDNGEDVDSRLKAAAWQQLVRIRKSFDGIK